MTEELKIPKDIAATQPHTEMKKSDVKLPNIGQTTATHDGLKESDRDGIANIDVYQRRSTY